MFFYRFLRSENVGKLKSELDAPVEFYIKSEAANERDFVSNTPIVQMESEGVSAQILFGMVSIEHSAYLHEYLLNRILARIDMSYLINEWNVTLHKDQQLETGRAKYLLAPYYGDKIIIPDSKVEILSVAGWKPKEKIETYRKDIFDLKPEGYFQLIESLSD